MGKVLGVKHKQIKITIMKTIKLIFKGVLFYITFLFTLFFMLGVDSIMDNDIFLQFMIVEMILVLTCTNIISKDELYKITFSKYLNKE